MPLHDYRCPEGHVSELMVEQGVDIVPCLTCGNAAGKVFLKFPAAFVQADIHYTSPIDGRHVTNKQSRSEDLARSGCIPYDPMMKQDQSRRIEREDKTLEDKIGDSVDEAVAQMPVRKREKLEAEMAGGMDVSTQRGTMTEGSIRSMLK